MKDRPKQNGNKIPRIHDKKKLSKPRKIDTKAKLVGKSKSYITTGLHKDITYQSTR